MWELCSRTVKLFAKTIPTLNFDNINQYSNKRHCKNGWGFRGNRGQGFA